MQRLSAVAHILFWIFLLCAFFFFSAPKILRRAPKIKPTADMAFYSSNTLLQYATGTTNISEHLIAFFEPAPAGKRVLIIDHEDDSVSSLLGMLTAYLAWPRPVELVDLVRTHASRPEIVKLQADPPAAIVFCRLGRPSNLPEGKHFGRGLEVVPVAMTSR